MNLGPGIPTIGNGQYMSSSYGSNLGGYGKVAYYANPLIWSQKADREEIIKLGLKFKPGTIVKFVEQKKALFMDKLGRLDGKAVAEITDVTIRKHMSNLVTFPEDSDHFSIDILYQATFADGRSTTIPEDYVRKATEQETFLHYTHGINSWDMEEEANKD